MFGKYGNDEYVLQIRMWSWRHCWKYLPVFRFYIYSGIIMYGVYKFVLPSEFAGGARISG